MDTKSQLAYEARCAVYGWKPSPEGLAAFDRHAADGFRNNDTYDWQTPTPVRVFARSTRKVVENFAGPIQARA